MIFVFFDATPPTVLSYGTMSPFKFKFCAPIKLKLTVPGPPVGDAKIVSKLCERKTMPQIKHHAVTPIRKMADAVSIPSVCFLRKAFMADVI